MWNCAVCGKTSKPREPLQRFTVYRLVEVMVKTVKGFANDMRKQIAREIPVCTGCKRHLEQEAKQQELQKLENSLLSTKQKRSLPSGMVRQEFR